MYIPPELIAKGGVASLELTQSLIKIIENLRRDKSTPNSIANVLSQLETDAFVLTSRFIAEIDAWENALDKAKIDVKGRFGDLEETSIFWRNRHDKLMEAFEPTLKAIQQRLCGFIDDVVAIARCAGKEEVLGISFQETADLKRKIREDTNVESHSIKDVLSALRSKAEEFRSALGPTT
jgi:Asp-tRNA(Asn)/Glu-tRNA(Gln) amidotransferase C subunit